ncbi:transcriptional regulator [Salmonella enterica subsp. enterica serovar Uzaramo]|uniref:Transcriptional regulator n=1 Tax=Salmonella enterica subsp. enterica serovar Uzaramo TaxID=2565147 RepID=A0A636KCK3_SALET|nr:transcriptional regulator [Salmonella enterica]EBS4125639.1 transcriptional regulator [Salmonella enterica subsp. enterica serovar Kingston]EBS4438767.1 transcriptional regulator [Salmonella enterica subsp. enterica serovar Guinea]EBV1216459.1 transcriptional regulator [Salmonella enterica subsp. enterica serovar Neunkirchen]EBW5058540.1 transcriptional regulator [Salmonella enterica subsp. enterica serovar Somone]EBZ9043104.1 transcriptional regulator [Salmonella enterica subsp. enterica s
MTIYLINGTHTYNDKTNELKNIKTGKMIKIAAMRIKCLEYMLNHAQQEIIYKKQLTNELWGERSQFISDANLTQILYLLRRDLKGFGLSQFFSTVPRTGIKVDANIIISNENKNHPSSLKKEGYKYMALLFALLTMVIMVIYSIR